MTEGPKLILDDLLNAVWFEDQAWKDELNQPFLVFYAHILPSFSTLIRFLVHKAGFAPARIKIIAKPYSEIPTVSADLQKLGVEIIRYSNQFAMGRFEEHENRNLIDVSF